MNQIIDVCHVFCRAALHKSPYKIRCKFINKGKKVMYKYQLEDKA